MVEAQILKKPVVITNYSTAKSQVTNGFDGLIVELSEEGITNGIINLYKDKKRREELSYNCTSYMTKSAEEIQKLYSIM